MRRAAVVVLGGLLLAAIGCGPGQADVSGTVTLNGAPLKDGNIAFRPLPASAAVEAMGGPIKDGKYQVKARPGPNRVEITAFQDAPGSKEVLAGAPRPSIIPEKYNSQSELTKELHAGANEYSIELSSH